MEFNFDEWAKLAEQDKVAFEKRRQAVLKQAINECASTDRELRLLEGLQFRIDMIRRKHRTALASCMELSAMLMDHVFDLGHPEIPDSLDDSRKSADNGHKSGKIIPFIPPTRNK